MTEKKDDPALHTFLILEDEKTEANQLKKILEQLDTQKTIYVADNIALAEKIVAEHEIDVFLLDVNLPDGTGIEFAERLRQTERHKYTWIIFITGFDKYAYPAVRKAHCYSFLLKPYKQDEVIKSVEDILNKRVATLNQNEFLRFKSGKTNVRVPYSEIVYIESLNRKCYIYTIDQKYETSRISLKSFLDNNPNDRLLQCHRSFVVNRDYIKKFDKKYRGSILEMRSLNVEIPVGTNYVEMILDLI